MQVGKSFEFFKNLVLKWGQQTFLVAAITIFLNEKFQSSTAEKEIQVLVWSTETQIDFSNQTHQIPPYSSIVLKKNIYIFFWLISLFHLTFVGITVFETNVWRLVSTICCKRYCYWYYKFSFGEADEWNRVFVQRLLKSLYNTGTFFLHVL